MKHIKSADAALKCDWYTCKYRDVVSGSVAIGTAERELKDALEKYLKKSDDQNPGLKPMTRDERLEDERSDMEFRSRLNTPHIVYGNSYGSSTT